MAGYLEDVWIPDYTNSKLYRFNGIVLQETINLPFKPMTICVDRLNYVWLGSNGPYGRGDVYKLKNGVIVSSIVTGYACVYNMCVDKNGAIWCIVYNSNDGLYYIIKIYKNKIKIIYSSTKQPCSICCDKDGVVWFATASNQGYINKIVNDVVIMNIATISTSGTVYIYDICVNMNNEICVAGYNTTYSACIVFLNSSGSTLRTVRVNNNLNCICCSRDNIIYGSSASPLFTKIDTSYTVSYVGSTQCTSTLGISADKNNDIFCVGSPKAYLFKLYHSTSTTDLVSLDNNVSNTDFYFDGDMTGIIPYILDFPVPKEGSNPIYLPTHNLPRTLEIKYPQG